MMTRSLITEGDVLDNIVSLCVCVSVLGHRAGRHPVASITRASKLLSNFSWWCNTCCPQAHGHIPAMSDDQESNCLKSSENVFERKFFVGVGLGVRSNFVPPTFWRLAPPLSRMLSMTQMDCACGFLKPHIFRTTARLGERSQSFNDSIKNSRNITWGWVFRMLEVRALHGHMHVSSNQTRIQPWYY